MIILNTANPDELWQKICSAARAHRIEGWEPLSSDQIALFDWPTRHTRLLMYASINTRQNRLVLLEQNGRLPCPEACLARHQEALGNRLAQLFPDDIDLMCIAETTVKLHAESSAG